MEANLIYLIIFIFIALTGIGLGVGLGIGLSREEDDEDGKVKTFLPFSKNVFINEWSHKLNMNKYEIKTVMSQANKHFSKSKFDDNPEKWFANNCLVRNEYPLRRRRRWCF